VPAGSWEHPRAMTDPREQTTIVDQASAPPPPPPPYEWGGPPTFLSAPVPAAVPPPRRGPWRWVVALLATVVIIVAGIGIAVFAQSSRSNASIGPTFLPANTVAFADARLDLPGNQREKLITFLSHFPGFADQASFDLKVNETFDRWVGDASQGKLTYTSAVKPWFSGQVAVGLTQVPEAKAAAPMAVPHGVIGFGVKDRAKLDATITSVRALAGSSTSATFSDEDYNGTNLVTVKSGNGTYIFAITDTVLLIGTDSSDVKQSIDLLAAPGGSLAKDPTFSTEVAQLPAERLGTMYVASSAFAALTAQGKSQNPLSQCGSAAALSGISQVGALVAQGDGVSLEFRVNSGSAGVRLSGPEDLAARMPADTQVYLAAPGIGKTAHDLVSCLKPQLTAAISATQLQQVETALGSKVEDYLDFLGDVAIGGSYDGTKVHAGIVGNVADESTATNRVQKLLTLVRLGASAGGLPVTSTETKVGDITVTTIDFGKLPGVPTSLPVDTSVSVAVGGGHFYLGTGDFAAVAAGRQKTDSLAGTTRYTSALSAAGTGIPASLYVDLAAVKTAIENAAHADSNYTTNVKPYLDPLDRMSAVSAPLDAGSSVRVQLFVK
jgi:hypothetical protein